MNNIYVDELPKSCIKCPFCKDIKVNLGMDRLLFCTAYKSNKWKLMKDIDKCFNKCEIKNKFKPLSDRLAEERKKVCDEICVAYAKRLSPFFGIKISISTAMERLDEVLDQIERSE